MSDNPFDELMDDIEKARKSLQAVVSGSKGMKRTVIVHPQLGKDADEAALLSSDWRAREEKELTDQVMKALE